MDYKCKCGNTTDFFIKKKGNNTGLYCSDCGKWITWLSKDQIRTFENQKKFEKEYKSSWSEQALKETGLEINKSYESIRNQLKSFIDFLDKEIDRQLCRKPLSMEDSMIKSVYAHAYEKDKNALINILNGKDWNEVD